MLKLRLTLCLCCFTGLIAIAQTDSTARRDSLVQDLKDGVVDNMPTLSLDDNDLGDGGDQNISSLLTAGRDPFYAAASFNFSSVRFRIKGYESDLFSTYINGIPMNNLDNGWTPFGLWGGLNDVMRNRDNSWGLRNNTFAYGEIGGNTNIDTRASRQRAQTSINYALSNRNYDNRIMLTHSTGMSKKGWAFSLSGSRRWANEGFVPGTFYNGFGYFAAIDKRVGQNHLFSLTVFGAPTENGRQGSSVQEMNDLAGTNFYNPNWGYQNGQKRNSKIGRSHQPVFIFTHDFRLSTTTTLTTSASYMFGERSVTSLDWYNSADPRPDYYRYLPSYTGTWSSNPDPIQAEILYQAMKNDINLRQINWQRLYDANRMAYDSVKNVNGVSGNTVKGKRARYIIEDRVIDNKRLNFNTVFNTKFSDNIEFTAGASYQQQENRYFKRVDDLLGAEFYVNVNQFAERDYRNDEVANQWDLDDPNRILKEGDEFGYDYNLNVANMAGWMQGVFKFSKFDFFLAGEISQTEFYRQGNKRVGLFPTSSFGKGESNTFTNYSGKAGITYKLNGRNYFFVNASHLTRAPYFENVYVSPRTRNSQQDIVESEIIQTAEAGYIMNAPNLKIRLSGYYTRFQNGMEVMPFYHDEYQNFVNYAINGIDKLHFGGEFGVEAKLTQTLTLNVAAAVGRYYYDSKQNATITADNSASVLGRQIIYAENMRVPSTPMEAYSLGLSYRSPKFWFVSLTGNYFDQSYLSFNPVRRTWDALKVYDYGSAAYNEVFDQEKFDAQFMLDFFGGYSWKLPKIFEINKKPTFLAFNLGISNILDNRDIKTGGYEQLRYDSPTSKNDPVTVGKFPPRYYFGYGLNYYAGFTLRF